MLIKVVEKLWLFPLNTTKFPWPEGDRINGVPLLWEMFSFLVLETDFYKEIYVFSLGVQGFSSAMAEIAICQMEVMTPPNYM